MNLRHAFLLPALPILHAISADQTWISGNANNDWNTTAGLNWDAGVAWTQGNNAIFGGTGETVTLTEGITVDDMTFNVAGYTITGNTLSLGATAVNAAANTTISSILAGPGATLAKTGAGQLALTGNNSFDGGLTISAGPNTQAAGAIQLSTLSAGNFVGQGTGQITMDNTASMTGLFFTGNSGAVTNPVQFSNSATAGLFTRLLVQSNAGRVIELSGLLTGGSATSAIRTDGTAGAGVARVKVTNAANSVTLSYWELWRGGLEFTSDGALGNAGNDFRMDVSTDKAGTGLMFGADNITLNAGRALNVVSGTVVDTQTFTGSRIDGGVTLNSIIYKRGTTGLTFTGTNTGNASAELRFMEPSTVTLGVGGATGDLHSATYVNFNGQTGSVLAVNRTGTVSLAGTGDDGKISGPGSVVLSGSAVLNLGNSTSDFSGGITINGGQVRATATSAGATGSLGTGPVTIANGAALHFFVPTGTTSTFANNIQLPSTGSQQFIISAPSSATTVRLTGQLTGGTAGQTYRLVDSNAGSNHNNVLVLDNAANNFQGTIEMWRGTLGFTSDAALGNADNDIRHYTENLNGSLRFDADNITLNPLRTITLVSASVMPFNTQSYTGTVDGVITGPGQLIKQGSGTLVLNAANTFTGPVVINAGAVSAATIANGGADSPIGKSSAAATGLVLGGGTLRYTGTSVSIDRAFTLTAATVGAIKVTAPGTNLTLSGGTAATTGSLNKTGPGTLTLTGVNAHTGNTTVSEGTLYLENIQSAGIISVSSTATLGGGGQTGDVDMLNGGFLLPGSAGRADNWLQVGNLSLAGTTELQFELDAPDNGAALAINDLVIATSTPFLGGVVNVTPLGAGFTGAAPGSKWKLIELTAGTVPAHSLTLAPALASGYSLEAVEGIPGAVYLVAVPEAGTATLLLLSGLLLRGIGLRKHGKG